MPSSLPMVGMEAVTPRPAKMSEIFPTARTSKPAPLSLSRSVSPGGSREKSCRPGVRSYRGHVPVKGRAITLPTACSPTRRRRAALQYSYSVSGGTTDSCAAIWNTLSAEV